jgi:hypothetical protein
MGAGEIASGLDHVMIYVCCLLLAPVTSFKKRREKSESISSGYCINMIICAICIADNALCIVENAMCTYFLYHSFDDDNVNDEY